MLCSLGDRGEGRWRRGMFISSLKVEVKVEDCNASIVRGTGVVFLQYGKLKRIVIKTKPYLLNEYAIPQCTMHSSLLHIVPVTTQYVPSTQVLPRSIQVPRSNPTLQSKHHRHNKSQNRNNIHHTRVIRRRGRALARRRRACRGRRLALGCCASTVAVPIQLVFFPLVLSIWRQRTSDRREARSRTTRSGWPLQKQRPFRLRRGRAFPSRRRW